MNWIKRNWWMFLVGLVAVPLFAICNGLYGEPVVEPPAPKVWGSVQRLLVEDNVQRNIIHEACQKLNAQIEEVKQNLELTAHAQKPEPRQIEDNEVLGVKVDRQRTVLFVVPPDFWAQVEQHCVAVLTEKHDGNLPISFSKGNAVAHIPEQTLKLRCQSREKP